MRLACRFTAGLTLVAAVAAVAVTSARAQTLTWLGPTGASRSIAYGVSSNGVVVGFYSDSSTFRDIAFRWQNGIMTAIEGHPSGNAHAYSVSADGSVVTGWRLYNDPYEAGGFRWQQSTQGLEGLDKAWAVSADGSTIVGQGSVNGFGRALRWNGGQTEDLGVLPNPVTVTFGNQTLVFPHTHSDARGVSADGSIVVGTSYFSFFGGRAFQWTQLNGMQELPILPGGWTSSALAVSANGHVIVGSADDGTGNVLPVIWKNGAVQSLGSLGGDFGYASSVSADGKRVVGSSRRENGGYGYAFLWTEQGGLKDLNLVYANLLSNGSWLGHAMSVSPNGRYIAGQGYNAATGRYEAFVLDTIPEPSSMVLMATGLAAVALRRRRKA